MTGENSFKKYDRAGAYHYKMMHSDPFYAAKINKALSIVNPGSVVCDIGCGDGVFLKYAKEMGASVFGLDASAEGIRFARKFSGCKTLCVGSAYTLPLQTASVDLIVMIDVVNYFQDYSRAIREASRALKEKGSLIIMSPPDVDIEQERNSIPDSWQKQVCSVKDLSAILEEGWKICEVTFIRKPALVKILQGAIHILRVSGVLGLLRRVVRQERSEAKSDSGAETLHIKNGCDIILNYYKIPKLFVKRYEALEFIIIAQKD